MSDEHQDWIQDKTDEDNTRDNLERLQEDGDETSLNTNDEPDDTKSLSSKSNCRYSSSLKSSSKPPTYSKCFTFLQMCS